MLLCASALLRHFITSIILGKEENWQFKTQFSSIQSLDVIQQRKVFFFQKFSILTRRQAKGLQCTLWTTFQRLFLSSIETLLLHWCLKKTYFCGFFMQFFFHICIFILFFVTLFKIINDHCANCSGVKRVRGPTRKEAKMYLHRLQKKS